MKCSSTILIKLAPIAPYLDRVELYLFINTKAKPCISRVLEVKYTIHRPSSIWAPYSIRMDSEWFIRVNVCLDISELLEAEFGTPRAKTPRKYPRDQRLYEFFQNEGRQHGCLATRNSAIQNFPKRRLLVSF
jgi:hypothetical protein